METIKNLSSLRFVKITLGLLFALVIFPSNIKAISILVFGIATLNLVLRRKWNFDRKFFFTNALFFIVIALTFFYSENSDYASRKLQTMASLLIFPLVFSLLTKEEGKAIFKNLNTYLWIYVIGVFLLNVVPFIIFYITKYTFAELIEHYPTLVRIRMDKYSIHPIYSSMHCSAAILFSFYIFKKIKSKWIITALIFIVITLVAFLLLYAKKGPLIALIVVFSLFILFQYKKGYLKLYLLAVGTLIALTVLIPKTRERFVELLNIETLSEGEFTSTNIRYTIYVTSKKLISNAPFLGYGIGDYGDVLVEEYKKDNNTHLYTEKYNAHNQYISMVLIGGIPILLLFIFMFGMNMIYAIRFNNQLFILLIVFYSIVMFTENILEREDGVIFFAFFLNFFALKSLYAKEE